MGKTIHPVSWNRISIYLFCFMESQGMQWRFEVWEDVLQQAGQIIIIESVGDSGAVFLVTREGQLELAFPVTGYCVFLDSTGTEARTRQRAWARSSLRLSEPLKALTSFYESACSLYLGNRLVCTLASKDTAAVRFSVWNVLYQRWSGQLQPRFKLSNLRLDCWVPFLEGGVLFFECPHKSSDRPTVTRCSVLIY